MEILGGIIFSIFTKEYSQAESDKWISRLQQQLDKLRTDPHPHPHSRKGWGFGKVQPQPVPEHTSLCTGTSASSRATPIWANRGLTVNLHRHCHRPPWLALVLCNLSLTRTSSGCSSEQEHCHQTTETYGDYVC